MKLQKRAAMVGFDWPSLAPVLAKAEEEIAELKVAIAARGDETGEAASAGVTEEFGDLLFVMVNLARHLKVDPESTLRDANAKFMRRFAKATGMSPLDYVHALRLEEAKHLLESTELPVEAIANDVGYEDTSFFGRLFRRKTGITPLQYRLMQKALLYMHCRLWRHWHLHRLLQNSFYH